jgi:hypothetical protein
MPFVFEPDSLALQAAGVFFVNFTLRFQRPPVRRDILDTCGFILSGGTGRDAGKNAGRYRSANRRLMSARQRFPYLVDGDKSSGGYHPHQFVHFQRGRNDAGAGTPFLTHVFGYLHYPGFFALVEFFLPGLFQLCHCTAPHIPHVIPSEMKNLM